MALSSARGAWLARLALLLLAPGLVLHVAAGPPDNIVNGTAVQNPLEKFSFFALMTTSPGSDRWKGCGASIISETYALTAAHCVRPCRRPGSSSRLAIWVGDVRIAAGRNITPREGSQSFRTEAVRHCHPDYDGRSPHGYDVALLKLAKKVPSWVKPAPLSLQNPSAVAAGELVTAIGFGRMQSLTNPSVMGGYPSQLHEAQLEVFALDAAQCVRSFTCENATNRHRQLCAGATKNRRTDTCRGDSGSPLLTASGVLVGITSWGSGPGCRLLCASTEYSGMYMRVSAFAPFIRRMVADLP